MATYLQSITDSPESLRTPVHQVDFGFLSAGLQKKEGQYQQGLSQVASDYSAILNAPILNIEGQQKRAEYIKNVQEGLKKVSTTDLSLPKNVAQAESLYTPFWQDTLMLKHIAATKEYNNQVQTASSFRDSKDKEQRDQYNPIAMQYLQDGAEDLKNAPWTEDGINKLQSRKFVPFADINADVDAAYKAEKQSGIDSVFVNGNGITTQHNGVQSKDAFKVYYLSKVGNKYDQQMYVTEAVRVRRAKNEILRQNPGLDEKQVYEHLATESLDNIDKLYQGQIGSYNAVVKEWDTKYKDVYTQIKSQSGRATPQQQQSLDYYKNQMQLYNNQLGQYVEQYKKYGSGDKNNVNYQKTIQDISEHPEDYLTNIQKGIMADNWASGMSVMSTSTKIELDPRWNAYREENNKSLDRQLRQREIDATKRGQSFQLFEKTGQTIPGGKTDPRFYHDVNNNWHNDGYTPGTTMSLMNPSVGSLTGYNTIDPAHLNIGLDKVEQVQAQNIARVTNSIYDPKGISSAFETSGLSGLDVINFTEGAKRQASGQQLSTEQVSAMNQVFSIMEKEGISKQSIKSPQDLQAAVLRYSAIAAQRLWSSGNTAKIQQGQTLTNAYMNISQDRDIVLANKRTYDEALNKEIFSNPKFQNLLIDDNGVKRLVRSSDIAAMTPDITIEGENGKPIKIPGSRLAESMFHDTGGGASDEYIQLDGKRYKLLAIGNKTPEDYNTHNFITSGPGGKFEHQKAVDEYNKIVEPLHQKFGAPQDEYGNVYRQRRNVGNLSTLFRKAANTVIPTLKEYQNGIISQGISYDPNVETQLPYAIGISKELSNPANTDITKSYEEGKNMGENTKEIDAVKAVIGSAEEMKSYTSGPQSTVTPDGTPAWKYTFKSNTPDKTVGFGGVNLSNLAGRSFVLAVNESSNTPYLRSVPNRDQNFIHSNLLYDKEPITSDPTIQASGFKSIIYPYSQVNGKNTKCYIEIQQCIPDPINPGQSTWVILDKTHVNMLTGSDAKNPDEIVNKANSLLISHLEQLVSQAKLNEKELPDTKNIFR